MVRLLTEDGGALLTEDGEGLLVEPIAASATLRVFNRDFSSALAQLQGAARVGWVDTVLGVGSGQFQTRHNDDQVASIPGLLAKGNIVQVRIDQKPVFLWVMDEPERVRGDSFDVITVRGRGALSLLDQGLVYVPGEIRKLNDRQRVFGWMAFDHDDSFWKSITHDIGTQGDPDVSQMQGAPDGYPDPDAKWVWSAPISGTAHQPATSYFRWKMSFTPGQLEDFGRARLFVTALNEFVCWFDGEQVAVGRDWRGYAAVELNIQTDVTHTLAIEATNNPGGTINPAGVLWSLHNVTDDTQYDLGDVIARSGDAPGLALHNPDRPPGVTHGFVLLSLLEEAHGRGSLNMIEPDFDKVRDSAGRLWPEETEITVQAGSDTVLGAAERMREWPVDFRMNPHNLKLQAFAPAGVDRGAAPESGASTVVVPLDEARGLKYNAQGDEYDVFLVQSQFAWDETPSSGTPTENRREGFLSMAQSPTRFHALRQARRIRELMATPEEMVRFRTRTNTSAPVPYIDYFPGDTVLGPDLEDIQAEAWMLGDVRVDTIGAEVNDAGEIVWTHEAASARLMHPVERLMLTRRALGDGTLGGRSGNATSPTGGGGRQIVVASRTRRIIVVGPNPPSGPVKNLLWVDTSALS